MHTARQAAKYILDLLPEDASWDDIMNELYVRQKIEAGLAAAEQGRTVPQDQARKRLLDDAN